MSHISNWQHKSCPHLHSAVNIWTGENIYVSLNGSTCQVSQRDEKGLISGAVLWVKNKEHLGSFLKGDVACLSVIKMTKRQNAWTVDLGRGGATGKHVFAWLCLAYLGGRGEYSFNNGVQGGMKASGHCISEAERVLSLSATCHFRSHIQHTHKQPPTLSQVPTDDQSWVEWQSIKPLSIIHSSYFCLANLSC